MSNDSTPGKTTKMVIENFENGYKEVYTTTHPDGKKEIEVKTFFDEVIAERSEQTHQTTTVGADHKKTTTGETVVTDTTKVKKKIMPKGVEVVDKATPITDENQEDRLGRKASLDENTKMVVEKFENGYKEIYTTVYPDGRIKTEVQTFYDSEEEEEEYEEYEETEESEPVVTTTSTKTVVNEPKKLSERKNSQSKLNLESASKAMNKVVPKTPTIIEATPPEPAVDIDISKLTREQLAIFEDQPATPPVGKGPRRVWKRQPATTTTTITEPTTGKKEIQTNYLKK